MQSISVVLPAPLWPMRPRISPSRSCEVDVVDGGDAAEALHDAAALEQRPARPRGSRGSRPAPRLAMPSSGSSASAASARRSAAGGAGDEHRAQDVGPLEQLGGRALEAHLALLHEHGPLGQVEGHVDRLLDDHDRRAAAVDLAHDLEQLADDGRRQAERQLVDHEQLGPGHERAAEGEHLLLAAGEVAGHLARALLEDREERPRPRPWPPRRGPGPCG